MADNNECLRRIANALDGGGGQAGERMYNNDYLRRIADGVESMPYDPVTGKVDATELEGVVPAGNLPSYYTYEQVGDTEYLTQVLVTDGDGEEG